nr:MAG TPA: hypothetical protein [Caudoviricetes sp.]
MPFQSALSAECTLNWWHTCFKSLCQRLSRPTQIFWSADFAICILRWEPMRLG